MASTIKIRAKAKKGVTTVKALITHPMETGLRKNKKTGKLIPAKFISEIMVKHNGNTVMDAEWGGAISKNPYLAFKFDGGAKDDSIELIWKDNQGSTDTLAAKIR